MGKIRVLVVDDSWTDLGLSVTPLLEAGYEVITAMDGDEGLEKVGQERPDCVILDVVLPKQNGFQVCRKLKQHEMSRHIPVILMSGKNTPLDRKWGLQQGADFYMSKPFDKAELIKMVQALVERGAVE